MGFRAAFAATVEYIDQHFSSAGYFQIYDIKDDEHSHVETRKTKGQCSGNCEGGFDHLLAILEDCDAVFVSKIGQSAAAFMIGHGKRVFEAAGAVEEIITELKAGNLIEEKKENGNKS